MNIWVLNMIDSTSPDGEGSSYKGRVIVRSPTEYKARAIVSKSFFIATKRKLGETVAANPWTNPQLVSCEKYFSDEYQVEGEECILYP